MQHAAETPPKGPPKVAEVPLRLDTVDGRTRTARRCRTIYADLAAALGREPTPADRALLVDAVVLALESEALAAKTVAGGPTDPDLRVRLSGALARALERLGIAPAPREPERPDVHAGLARIRDPEYWR